MCPTSLPDGDCCRCPGGGRRREYRGDGAVGCADASAGRDRRASQRRGRGLRVPRPGADGRRPGRLWAQRLRHRLRPGQRHAVRGRGCGAARRRGPRRALRSAESVDVSSLSPRRRARLLVDVARPCPAPSSQSCTKACLRMHARTPSTLRETRRSPPGCSQYASRSGPCGRSRRPQRGLQLSPPGTGR